MSGPSTKPKHTTPSAPVFVPHPDDEAGVLEGIREAESGGALSTEESEAYVRWLETGDAPAELRQLFETGDRQCPASHD